MFTSVVNFNLQILYLNQTIFYLKYVNNITLLIVKEKLEHSLEICYLNLQYITKNNLSILHKYFDKH